MIEVTLSRTRRDRLVNCGVLSKQVARRCACYLMSQLAAWSQLSDVWAGIIPDVVIAIFASRRYHLRLGKAGWIIDRGAVRSWEIWWIVKRDLQTMHRRVFDKRAFIAINFTISFAVAQNLLRHAPVLPIVAFFSSFSIISSLNLWIFGILKLKLETEQINMPL